MIDIRWDLLQPVDIGGNFNTGFQMGQQLVQKEKMKSALAAYAQDPSNPAVQSALASLSPQFALQLGQSRAEEARKMDERKRIGSILVQHDTDPTGARRTALEGGDIDLAKQLESLDDDSRKRLGDMYKGAAPLAYQALKLPYEQRKAYIESIKPQLKAAGWDDSHLDSFDPTDANLQGIVQSNMTLEQAMGRDKINYEPVPEGARLVPFDSFGRPTTSDTGAAPAKTSPPPAAAVSEVASTLSAALPAPVVAGFLGNLDVEGGYGGARGDGGAAAGIAQWHGERQANFERIIGKPISQATHGEQARFIVWEMQNPQAAGMTVEQRDRILAAKTPEEAAALIDRHYERSSGQHRQQRVEAAGRHVPNEASIRQHALDAIAAGADPAAVKARAASMGVTL